MTGPEKFSGLKISAVQELYQLLALLNQRAEQSKAYLEEVLGWKKDGSSKNPFTKYVLGFLASLAVFFIAAAVFRVPTE